MACSSSAPVLLRVIFLLRIEELTEVLANQFNSGKIFDLVPRGPEDVVL